MITWIQCFLKREKKKEEEKSNSRKKRRKINNPMPCHAMRMPLCPRGIRLASKTKTERKPLKKTQPCVCLVIETLAI
jgi:hypothetical protein